jgi:hypothetical protein
MKNSRSREKNKSIKHQPTRGRKKCKIDFGGPDPFLICEGQMEKLS